jgi:hypothetical protein
MKYLAFDIEISKSIPEGTDDWKSLHPLGISCAATLTNGREVRLWHGPEQSDGRLAAQMTPEECRDMARYLIAQQAAGYTVVTWNGLGFDFEILTEECQGLVPFPEMRAAALSQVDPAFHMFCDRGFMIGLDAAAKGMGLAGKPPGMRGDLAPIMWAQGRVQQDKVLEYVAQDVRTTADLYELVTDQGILTWVSRSGRPAEWRPRGGRLLTAREAMALPEPDTSWMRNPWPRAKFTGWLNAGD